MKKILIVFSLLLLSACSNGQAGFSVTSDTNSELTSEITSNETTKESDEETKSNYYGDLVVEGTNVVDSNGQVVQLQGVSSHGINWFPDYVNYDLMKQIQNMTNINTFRIAMYTEDYNGYLNTDESSQQQLLQLIDDAVSYAQDLDMYIIIDWHILSDGNPLDHTDEAKEFFELMSEKYGDLDNVIFEICNEPNGDTKWTDIEKYANQVIPVIRENSDNLIIVGTPNWSQDVDSVNKLDYDNVVYSLHFYAATHKQELIDKAQLAIDNGIPLFVSEFGISEASGSGQVDTTSANTWIKFLNDNQISYVMWNLSNKDESSALIKSDITNTADLTYDDLTASGQWYYDTVKKESNKSAADTTNSQVSTEQSTNSNKQVEVNQNEKTWDGGAKYTFDVVNKTNKAISNYTIKVMFKDAIKVTDNWNSNVTTSDNVVTLKPVGYNRQIPANEQVEDIGIIVEGQNPSIESIDIEY